MARIFRRLRRTAAATMALSIGVGVAQLAGSATATPLPTLPIGAPKYTVDVNAGATPGYIYYSSGISAAALVPGVSKAVSGIPAAASANIVVDKAGREVWRYDPPAGQDVSNFRTQTYRGKRVLTWWQGETVGGHGSGADYIADEHGRVIEKLDAGGAPTDVHEFRLTPDGRALVTSYHEVDADLTAIGGPKNGKMYDAVASVVDVATKRVLMRWSAAQHVPLTDSTATDKLPGNDTYDPYHINSIALDPEGDLVISMRDTSTVYDVDIASGAIKWRLGGKRSTFNLGRGVQFAFQHDAEFAGPNTIRLFNNNSSGFETDGLSSVQWIHLNHATHQATLVRNQTHPGNLVAFAMGDAQPIPNGNTLVGWGMAPHISEFTPSGKMVYDARLPFGTYRAYPANWAPTR
ncbi:arylsulfotransferase family protein [Gordonia sp. SL306]|uniref:arylsulfotransferase family protein n=1 Tax=Gordonia sp. SL306 TaxID=2995145 RepID=UPI00226F2F3C|nr:arylsulfotransferase family protein [Gordonia sp. SL306]WAC55541.1 arylsulfotransferase family protein [Gordonia sp. SL306]